MIKIFNILFFTTIIILFNSDGFADTKKDCSQYSTKTLSGLTDKIRCKKGLQPVEKSFLKSLDWKKGKFKKTYVPGKPCDEYSTKTFSGLVAKIKCKKN